MTDPLLPTPVPRPFSAADRLLVLLAPLTVAAYHLDADDPDKARSTLLYFGLIDTLFFILLPPVVHVSLNGKRLKLDDNLGSLLVQLLLWIVCVAIGWRAARDAQLTRDKLVSDALAMGTIMVLPEKVSRQLSSPSDYILAFVSPPLAFAIHHNRRISCFALALLWTFILGNVRRVIQERSFGLDLFACAVGTLVCWIVALYTVKMGATA